LRWHVFGQLLAVAHIPGSQTPGESITLDVNNASRYYSFMIVSFKCADTASLAKGKRVRRFVQFERIALRKIRQLQVAEKLDDLRVPPGNRLESLKGDRKGQYSIRINDQFRICFRWTRAGAADVEIVDYHQESIDEEFTTSIAR
jgi:proteic killer suppression protein